jgi:hypothetical protein
MTTFIYSAGILFHQAPIVAQTSINLAFLAKPELEHRANHPLATTLSKLFER